MSLVIELLTPEKKILEEEADELVVETVQGQIAILTNHIPLLTKLLPGELTLKKNGKEHHVAVTGGFLEVAHNKVTILADYAIKAEDIEVSKVKAAQERAAKLMESAKEQQDFAFAQTEHLRAILQLNIANKRRRQTTIPGQ